MRCTEANREAPELCKSTQYAREIFLLRELCGRPLAWESLVGPRSSGVAASEGSRACGLQQAGEQSDGDH